MLKVDSPWKTKDYSVSFFSYINHYIVEKPQSLLIILPDLRLSGLDQLGANHASLRCQETTKSIISSFIYQKMNLKHHTHKVLSILSQKLCKKKNGTIWYLHVYVLNSLFIDFTLSMSKKTDDDTLPNLLHLAISGGGKSKQPKVINRNDKLRLLMKSIL